MALNLTFTLHTHPAYELKILRNSEVNYQTQYFKGTCNICEILRVKLSLRDTYLI